MDKDHLAAASNGSPSDANCICRGNWRAIVKEYEPLLGKVFEHKGERYTFFGLVHGGDDYYYGMCSRNYGFLRLLSCVGSIEGHGYVLRSAAVSPDAPAK